MRYFQAAGFLFQIFAKIFIFLHKLPLPFLCDKHRKSGAGGEILLFLFIFAPTRVHAFGLNKNMLPKSFGSISYVVYAKTSVRLWNALHNSRMPSWSTMPETASGARSDTAAAIEANSRISLSEYPL